jgi:hypothetical protein
MARGKSVSPTCNASDDACRFFYGGPIVAKKKAKKGAKKAAKKKK